MKCMAEAQEITTKAQKVMEAMVEVMVVGTLPVTQRVQFPATRAAVTEAMAVVTVEVIAEVAILPVIPLAQLPATKAAAKEAMVEAVMVEVMAARGKFRSLNIQAYPNSHFFCPSN